MGRETQTLTCINFLRCLLLGLREIGRAGTYAPQHDRTEDGLPAFDLSVVNAFWHLQLQPVTADIPVDFLPIPELISCSVRDVHRALAELVQLGSAWYTPPDGIRFQLDDRPERGWTRAWQRGVAPQQVYVELAEEWVDTYHDPLMERKWLALHYQEMALADGTIGADA